MDSLTVIVVGFVALFHIQVFVMEALLWKTPKARQAFGTTVETAKITYPLAINQGVYNLFLSAGLFLSFLLEDPVRFQAQLFFLICVVVAAITVGAVVNKRIMLIQGVPALTALILVIITH